MQRPLPHPTPLRAYGVALLLVIVAVGLRWLLDPWLGGSLALVTLFGAIAAAVWYGGYRPAILAAGVGYAACTYLFVTARGTVRLSVETYAVSLVAFTLSATILIFLGEVLRRSRKRAADTAELIRITFASIGDGVITTDPEGRITYLNGIAETLTGWPRAEAVGKPLEAVFRILNETSRRPVENPALRALREGVVVGLANHTVLLTRDGREHPIDDSAAPITDDDGRVTGCVLIFRDVTARRGAERKLRRSEQELSDFFDNASIGLQWVGPDGVILRANRAELDLLGYEAGEYVGRHIAEFHVDQELIAGVLERLVRGESIREQPARLRCKDGSIRDVLINSSGLIENGRFVHSRCFTFDVTERRKGEGARRLLAAVVAASSDAIVSKTLDGIILSWNAGAERLFGYSAAEAIGQAINIIIPPDLQDQERMILDRIARGEPAEHFQTVRVAKDGRLLDVSLTVSPLRDDQGRVVGASKVARDVSGQKRAEQAIRESEERFRELANNIDQFVWTCDALGQATWFNRRWCEYTGTSLEDMVGDGWTRVHDPRHLQRVVDGLQRCNASGDPWEDTFPLRSKDGRYRWFLSRAKPIRDTGGRVIRWLGTNTDVTEYLQMEEALREADRRKDEFLATLAHELRNPLAPIRNSLELLKRAEGNPALAGKSLAIMDRQMSVMERLIDDLLDLSRITSNRLELRSQCTELASAVYHALESCRSLAEEARHTLSVSLPDDPIFVNGDPVRLAQIFSNLLTNACKFTEPGGLVSLSAARAEDEVIITVKDTGVGLPPDMLERVFDMFQQVGRGEEKGGGLGIGLSLVKQLVELHGGHTEARSEGPGRGSEFVVRLPTLAAPPPVSEEGPASAGAPQPRRRVLVVDDNQDGADSLAKLLSLSGQDARAAYDGLAAIEAAERFTPEVILLDIGMPKLNGFEVCRRIRRQPWATGIVLVAVTGWGQDHDRRRSLEAGFDGHLVKPVDYDRLMKLLASLTPPEY